MRKIPRSTKLQPVPPDLDTVLETALTSQRDRTLNAILTVEEMESRLTAARQLAEDRYATYEAMLAEVDGQLTFDLSKMFWSCMVCGEQRADKYIGVAHRPIPGSEDLFPQAHINVRYCTDREECTVKANAKGPWERR